MQIGRVYMITSPSGKIYIGSTSRELKKRWENYKELNCKRQIRLYNSLKKYGYANHVFIPLWEGDIKDMLQQEFYYGHMYNVLNSKKGLNCALPKIDDSYPHVREDTRLKMSISAKKRGPHSKQSIDKAKETRKKNILKNRLNKPPLPKKERKSTLGTKRSEEFKKNLSIKLTNKKQNKEHVFKKAISNKKPILQYDLNNNFIKEWDGAVDIKKELNINRAHISECCKNKLKTAGGYKWEYK